MKVSLKIDQAKAKELLLLHVEKISFGVFAICFLLLCYSAFTRKAYDKTPDALIAESTRIDALIEGSKWGAEHAKDLQAPDLSQLADEALAQVDPSAYSLIAINPPVADNKARRGEPKFLALREVLAYPGYGAMALNVSGGRLSSSGGQSGGGAVPGGSVGGKPGGMDDMGMGGMKPPSGASPTTPGSSMPTGAARPSGGKTTGKKPTKNDKSKPEAKAPPKPKAAKPIDEADRPRFVAPGGSKIVGRQWACVVGAVPLQEQELEYRRAFQSAAYTNAEKDRPDYYFFDVERAEVSPSDPSGELQWEAVDVNAAWEESDKWAGTYPELVDSRYILDDVMTSPLPPLVNKNFDPKTVHHPRTPLAGQDKPAATEPSEDEKKRTAPNPRDRRSRTRSGAGGAGGAMAGRGMGGGISAQRNQPGAAAKERVAFKLCRFFDFTVGSGKSYRYRVRLELTNPNFGVRPQYLTDHALAAVETRKTDWSEPSPVVTIPRGDDVLAGDVQPGSPSKEPLAKVLVRKFSAERGMEIVKAFEMKRGALANNDKADVVVADPHDPSKAINETLSFESDVLLIDLAGGDNVSGAGGPKGLRAPGRILVMGEDGQLTIHSQFSDAAELDEVEQDQERLKSSLDGKSTRGGAAASSSAGPDIFNLGDQDDKSTKKKKR